MTQDLGNRSILLDAIPLVHFCCCHLCFWCHIQTIIAQTNVKKLFFSLRFSSRNFMDSDLMFRFFIHFELIFCMVWINMSNWGWGEAEMGRFWHRCIKFKLCNWVSLGILTYNNMMIINNTYFILNICLQSASQVFSYTLRKFFFFFFTLRSNMAWIFIVDRLNEIHPLLEWCKRQRQEASRGL